jgi:3-isopropylmalate/(R)-2-methylmalate dehydratase small subunit
MTTKNKPLTLRGKARIIPVGDVDTDMIFHNRYLHITDPNEMGKYIFGNLKGFETFPSDVSAGDLLIVGHNFGCGSSRQQAVDGLIALGISAIIGESFGAIYRRNAINAGIPLIEAKGILGFGLMTGQEIIVDLETGQISDGEGRKICSGKPMTKVQTDIYFAGGLLNLE